MMNPWTARRRTPYTLLDPEAQVMETDPALIQQVMNLPRMEQGSGKTVTGEYEEDQRRNQVTTQTQWPTSDKVAEVLASIRGIPELQAQDAGSRHMAEMLQAEMAQPVQADILRPLAALTDSVTGSNLSQAMPKAESGSDRRLKLLALADKIQDNKRDMAKSTLEAVGKLKSGTDTLTLLSQMGFKFGGKSADTELKKGAGATKPQVNNPMEKTWTEFGKANKDLLESLSGGQSARSLMETGTPIGDQMLRRKMIILSGDKRPSNEDVKQSAGDPRVEQILNQWYASRFDTGVLTNLNRDSIDKVLTAMERLGRKRLHTTVEGFSKSAPKFHPELNPSTVRAGLMERLEGVMPPPVPEPVPRKTLLQQFQEYKAAQPKKTAAPVPAPSPSPSAAAPRKSIMEQYQEMKKNLKGGK